LAVSASARAVSQAFWNVSSCSSSSGSFADCSARSPRERGAYDPIDEPQLRLPRLGLAQRRLEHPVDEGRHAQTLGFCSLFDQIFEVEIRGAERDVGAAIGGEHRGVRVAEAPRLGQRLHEVKRVSHRVFPPVLGEAAVRRAVGRRREIPAHVARRLAVALRAPRQAAEAAREALRHQRHHADPGIERAQRRGQLAHREARVLVLAPEGDPVVEGIVALPRAVIGHVEQEHVARAEAAALGVEPFAHVRLRGGRERHAGDRRAHELDRRVEVPPDAGVLEHPEISLGRGVALREIRRGIGAVAAEDVDLLGLDPARQEQRAQALQVHQMRAVVDLRDAAAADHEDVIARRIDRRGGRGDGRRRLGRVRRERSRGAAGEEREGQQRRQHASGSDHHPGTIA
jgi:hypothetical protein